MREGALPAAVVAAAVIAFVGYASFQGSSHAVDFAVTGSDVAVVPAAHALVAPPWQRRARSGSVLVVDVAWQAGDSLPGGSYALLVTTPPGWRHLGCRPECEWSNAEEIRQFARRLPRDPYPLAATFDADQTGEVRVAFGSPRGTDTSAEDYTPAAWLVQTNGDDVLGAERVPLTRKAPS